MKGVNEENNGGWEQLKENIIQAGREMCGETKGIKRKEREPWWWKGIVQQQASNEKGEAMAEDN